MSEEMQMLNKELAACGLTGDFINQRGMKKLDIFDVSEEWARSFTTTTSPIQAMVEGTVSAKPYIDTILKHAGSMNMRDKCWIARVVSEKGLKEAVPFLLSIFDEYDGQQCDLYAVGNAWF